MIDEANKLATRIAYIGPELPEHEKSLNIALGAGEQVVHDATHAAGHILHGTAAFRRTNLALFAAGFATFGLLYCVQPLMPEFSRDFHVDAATSSLSLSVTTGVLAVAMLFAGAVSDAWGRKAIMVASLLASAALVLLSATMPTWSSMLLVRAVLGLALSGLPAVAMTYVAEEVHPESLGLAMGLYISGTAIGGMSGRLIAGIAADFFSWRSAVMTVGVLGAVAGVVFWRFLPPSRHFAAKPLRLRPLLASFASLMRDAGLPWLFAEGFLLMGSFVTLYNYVGYRLLAPPFSLRPSVVGLIFLVYLIGSFSSTWMGHIAGRRGRRKVLWSAFVIMLVGLGLTAVPWVPTIVAGIAVITFGFFAGHSIVSSWVGRRALQARAHASSMYLFAYYMGSSVAGACGGLAWNAWGWWGVVAYVGVLLMVALAIAMRLFRLEPLAVPG